MTAPPTWSELVTLMVHGPDPTLRGRIRHDDAGEGTYVGYSWMDDEPGPVIAGVDADGVLAWRDGARLRLEDLDGTATLICDGETVWSFADRDGRTSVPLESRPRHVVYGVSGTDLLDRGTAERWLGDDFTQPTGPPVATTFLGRAAWAVELAPPRRKPHALQVVVDAETGLPLQQRNDGFGTVTEWVELAVGEELDPALFSWDGPVVTLEEQRGAQQREHEADLARRDAWVREHVGPASLTIALQPTIELNDWKDDGSFYASLEPGSTLQRRPRSDEPWDRVEDDAHRWSDDRWDWAFSTWGEPPLAPGALEAIVRQLSGGAG